MRWNISKKSLIGIWCMVFWSVFAIQLIPKLFGGALNIIIYFSFFFILLGFSHGKINVNIPISLGVLLYSVIVFAILKERNTISFFGITMNYSAYKMIFWVMGIACGALFLQQSKAEDLIKFRSVYIPVVVSNMLANLFITIFIDPTASKYAGKTSDGIVGVSDYDSIYSLVLIVPILFYFVLKSKGREKRRSIILFVLSLVYVFKSTFFIAILACILGIVFVLLNQLQNKTGKLFGMLILGSMAVFFVIRSDLIFEMMLYVADHVNSPSLSTRLIELVGVLRDGKDAVDAVVRLDIYTEMINGFFRHPFLGCIIAEPEIYINYAGHTTILDTLCGYGLITFVPLFCGFNKLIKSIRGMLSRECQDIFQCCYWVFIFIAFFNPVTNGYLMMCTMVTVPYVLLRSSQILKGE